jgi:hypothetical protein
MNTWQTLDDFMKDAWESRDRQAWRDAKSLVRNYGLEGDFDLVPSFIHSPGYGAEMIDADGWVTYAEELAEELGLIPSDAAWPSRCIDWESAAQELAQDYSFETINGHGFYCRER